MFGEMKSRPSLIRLVSLVAAAFFAGATGASAIIVGDPLGNIVDNTDPAVLDAHLAGESLPAFNYWQNQVFVNNASGVYLGYDASTLTGWVLGAAHVGNPASIDVGGISYSVTSSIPIGSSDMVLHTLDVSSATPSLAAVILAAEAASGGETALMFGRGYSSSATYPFDWAGPGGAFMRWGTNTVAGTSIVDISPPADPPSPPNEQPYVITAFDDPSSSSWTAYEGQGSEGDSGGGLFILRDGVWQLAGIAHFVYDPDEDPVNPSEYGDYTGYSDIYAHLATITGHTGTLIPEPSSLALLSGTVPLLFLRRRGSASRTSG